MHDFTISLKAVKGGKKKQKGGKRPARQIGEAQLFIWIEQDRCMTMHAPAVTIG